MSLQRLYPEDTSVETHFDIIAIHGLDGHPLDTWKGKVDGRAAGPGPIWVRDFLKERWPNARIFTWGYDTGRPFWDDCIASIWDIGEALLSRLEDERRRLPSQRPILFICHSLGGIVLKAALVKAREQNRYEWISPIPKAVAFFSTPHMGSRIANDLYWIAKVLPLASKKWPTLLKDRSKELVALSESFADRADELVYIVSFFETMTTKPHRSPIVDKKSATLGLSSNKETRLGISADHHGICKFESKEDPNYVLVLGELRRMIEDKLQVRVRENNIISPATAVANPTSSPSAVAGSSPSTAASGPPILASHGQGRHPVYRGPSFPPSPAPSQPNTPPPCQGSDLAGLNQAADEAFQRGKEDDMERAYQFYGHARAMMDRTDASNKARLFLIHDRMARCALKLCRSGGSSLVSGASGLSNWGSVDAGNLRTLDDARGLHSQSRCFVEGTEDEYRVWMTGFCIRILEAEMESAGGGLDRDTRTKNGLVAEAKDGEIKLLYLLESECKVEDLLADLHEIKLKLGCH